MTIAVNTVFCPLKCLEDPKLIHTIHIQCYNALDSRTLELPSTANLVIEFPKVCLSDNHFVFNKCFYAQVHGTSLGPKMAPGYACLGIVLAEANLWETCKQIPTMWSRYIDDIWGLLYHGPLAFEAFMRDLNNLYQGELALISSL